MKEKLNQNLKNCMCAYVVGGLYLLLAIASILPDLWRHPRYTASLTPLIFLLFLYLMSFLFPYAFGIIFLTFGLFTIFGFIAGGFPILGSIFLLPIVFIGYLLTYKKDLAFSNKKN